MTSQRRQRGATLVVALIMLVLTTLFALSSMKTATTSLMVTGNMQAKTEALNAAQETIETVISTPQFIANPANAVINPCTGPNTLCTDVTGDGAPEYVTQLVPPPYCMSAKPLKNDALNLALAEDLGCAAGQQQQFGVAGAVTGNSLCASSVWEISAHAQGLNSGANVTVRQGIGVRISADEAGSAC
ncbi:MAG TPA: PilX N-terminal domain-containing pilus assembly protein [Burkholderiales bacterium]|nr:PilX N-terminal domain-containing pilus assembly protein [Burkholderiales bacterium]